MRHHSNIGFMRFTKENTIVTSQVERVCVRCLWIGLDWVEWSWRFFRNLKMPSWHGCVALNTGHFCSPINGWTFTYVFYRGMMLGIRLQELLHFELWICYNEEPICMMLLEYKMQDTVMNKKNCSFHWLQKWNVFFFFVMSLCLTKGCPCCNTLSF